MTYTGVRENLNIRFMVNSYFFKKLKHNFMVNNSFSFQKLKYTFHGK